MIQTNEFYIPLVKQLNTQVKVEIDGTDEASKVVRSNFVKPVTTGIGTFRVTLKNAFGRITGKYDTGSIVKLFYDNTDGTRLQFQGRVDYANEKLGGGYNSS